MIRFAINVVTFIELATAILCHRAKAKLVILELKQQLRKY